MARALSIICFLLFQSVLAAGQDSETDEDREQCVQDWLQKQPDLLNRFGRDHLRFVCQRSQDWAEAASRETSPVADFLTPKQLEYLGRLRDCQGSDCLKDLGSSASSSGIPIQTLRFNVSDILIDFRTPSPTRTGDIRVVDVGQQGQTPGGDGRAVRKEYRVMSDEERVRYHEAIKKLKTDMIDGISKYDLLVIYHTPQESPEAHWGPAFLPFHREYLKQYELALRQVDPNIGLPYWDSTLDEGLPNPNDSILWTPGFLGNGDGPVTSGPFAGWTAVQELPDAPGERRLVRAVGQSPYGGLYKPSDIDFILSRPRFEDLTSCVDPTLEVTHGIVHSYVGGYMLDIGISPNDPSFFMHHCFIDCVWEQFRQTRQDSRQRQKDYPSPERSCNEFHNQNAPMKPFTIRNVDGLSERYTSELYRYDERPVCGQNGQCNPSSPYLFCDSRISRCLSKIQLNGNCTGLESQDACYEGTCRGGVCVMSADPPIVIVTGGPTRPTPPRTTELPTATRTYATISVTYPPAPTQTLQPPTHAPPPAITHFPNYPHKPSSRPPYVGGGGYYQWVTPPAQSSIPVAYTTITVVKGYGGYYAQHASDAVVSVLGLDSPPGYVSAIPAAMWPNTTSPSYIGACLIMIYDPDQTNQPVRFALSATDAKSRQCRLQCWDDSRKQYGTCQNGNSFQVGRNGPSDPIPYFRTSREALERRWTGSGYRRFRLPDYVVFQCP